MKDVNEAFERIMTGLDEAVEYLEEKQIDALKKKSEKTGIPYGILKQVYNRGMAAWRTGHRPGTTPQQWAFARVNSFATKSKGTWGGADKDLAAKARGSMKKEEVELDEGQKPYVSSDSDGKNVMSASGKVVKSFKDNDVDLTEVNRDTILDKVKKVLTKKNETDQGGVVTTTTAQNIVDQMVLDGHISLARNTEFGKTPDYVVNQQSLNDKRTQEIQQDRDALEVQRVDLKKSKEEKEKR